MSKTGLDLSKFKKISSDEHTSTLKHVDGHELRIAHKKLTPKLKGELDKLPLSGKVEKLADGGTAGKEIPYEKLIPEEQAANAPYGTSGDDGAMPLSAPGPQIASNGPMTSDEMPPMAKANPAQVGAPSPEPASPSQTDQNDPFGMQANTQAQIDALQKQSKGQQEIAQAQGTLGKEQAAAEQHAMGQQAVQRIKYEEANDDLLNDRTKLQQEIATSQINPKHYLDSMSTGGKISTGIGLILGGMGAGLTHGPNLAYQYLQNQIDRDIDVQKTDLGKKQNLLSHNFQATGDLRQAADMTRIQTNDILSSHLKQLAGQAQNTAAQGTMLDIAGKIDGQSAQLQHNLAIQKVLQQGMSSNVDPEQSFKTKMQYLRMNGQENIAKDMEAKHVPGVGQASKEVPGDVMKELIARNDLQKQIEDLQQFAAKHSGSFSPSINTQGKAKAQLVQDAIRRANAQGVFKESEKNFMEGIVSSNPTQIFEKYRSGKGYQEISRSNKNTLNNLKEGYGLPRSEGQTGEAPQIKIVNGVKYQRGPNGEAVAVK